MTVTLEGFHAVKHALRFAPSLVRRVTAVDPSAAVALCEQLAPDLVTVFAMRVAEGLSDHPTGVAGVAERPAEDRSVLSRRTSPLVVLDDPRHPGNAGAAIRVAAAAGASGVALVGPLDPWHPAVVRGSAGLHFALPVLAAGVQELDGPVWALDADGDPLGQVPDGVVLVVGSERAGVSPELRARAERVVSLPMTPGVSSLNLATALSAALYAWRLRA
ncbi:MAG: tRNA/rRNA methyltransferase (SpoU) [Frankiales bacterium]|nr:tRNA/rRNA methyltransferase (SpoU) [Frankiales bacterium]